MIPFANLLGGAKINTATPGDVVFEGTSLSTTWTVPAGVYELSIVGASPGANGNQQNAAGQTIPGGGGDGGDLRWGNGFPVTPGQVLYISIFRPTAQLAGSGKGGSYVVVADSGGLIYLVVGGASGRLANDAVTSTALGRHPVFGNVMIGGGDGGDGVRGFGDGSAGGGGGAGGYSGSGGKGSQTDVDVPGSGTGGGAAGGRGTNYGAAASYNGGGVGLYGQGASGVGSANAQPSQGGSGGEPGAVITGGAPGTPGGKYGGGGAGFPGTGSAFNPGGLGGLRFLWGQGPNNGGRAFPATNVATSSS